MSTTAHSAPMPDAPGSGPALVPDTPESTSPAIQAQGATQETDMTATYTEATTSTPAPAAPLVPAPRPAPLRMPAPAPTALARPAVPAQEIPPFPEWTPPTTATVAISVRATDEASAFGLACSDFSVAVTGEAGRSELATLIDAFEFVLMHPHFQGQNVDLLVANEGFSSAVAALLAAWPHINVITVAKTGYLMHRAGRVAHKVLHPETDDADTPAVPEVVLPRLTCATDGSAGYARNPLGAYAWVTESGEHGGGVLGNVGARVTELAAVTALVEAMPATRSLRVLIDCREVLDLVKNLQSAIEAQENVLEDVGIASWNTRYAHRLLALMPGRDIIFEKVTAHDGHPLNETADSLAVYLRRARQMGVADEVAAGVVERIVAEGLWAWSEQQKQAQPA